MASNKDEQGGYDVHFTTEIPDDLKCIICHLVLREPVQIMTCGHRFCEKCFEKLKIHAQNTNMDLLCPVDREAVLLGHVFPDRAASRLIGNLKVHCGNRDRGCAWVDDLRELRNHEDGCEFKIVKGMEELVIEDGRDGELDFVLKQILIKLSKCEDELKILKDDKKVKDEAIQILNISNTELRSNLSAKDVKMKELEETINKLEKKVEDSQRFHHEHEEDITKLQSRIDLIGNAKIETINIAQLQLQTQIANIEQKIGATKESIGKSIANVENIENVLFAHEQLQEIDKEVTFRWVMQDYLHMFRIGKDVYSPVFHTKVLGYSFQLSIAWEGPNKGKLGMYLHLHRGKTPSKFLGEFNYEYTLSFHGKGAQVKSARIRPDDSTKHEFRIKNGQDMTSGYGKRDILTNPYNNYIVNNSLLMSCILHL